jgi:hypothetical protein
LEELIPVPPDRVRGIGLGDTGGILAVWKEVCIEESLAANGTVRIKEICAHSRDLELP